MAVLARPPALLACLPASLVRLLASVVSLLASMVRLLAPVVSLLASMVRLLAPMVSSLAFLDNLPVPVVSILVAVVRLEGGRGQIEWRRPFNLVGVVRSGIWRSAHRLCRENVAAVPGDGNAGRDGDGREHEHPHSGFTILYVVRKHQFHQGLRGPIYGTPRHSLSPFNRAVIFGS